MFQVINICCIILQTPVWEESDIEDMTMLGTKHKRSNSLGSGDQKIKEVWTFMCKGVGLLVLLCN